MFIPVKRLHSFFFIGKTVAEKTTSQPSYTDMAEGSQHTGWGTFIYQVVSTMTIQSVAGNSGADLKMRTYSVDIGISVQGGIGSHRKGNATYVLG